jgi:hypothetical protein
MQRLSLQDREPDFDLVEPGGPRRREVEMHVTFEPAIVPWMAVSARAATMSFNTERIGRV